MNNNFKVGIFRNYLLKVKIPTLYYSDIIIIYVNNRKNIRKSRLAKFLLNFSASASAFAPYGPILLLPKIINNDKMEE